MDFLDIFTSLAGGGALGFIGTIASSAVGTWKENQSHKRTLQMMDKEHAHSLAEMDYEADKRKDEIELERENINIEAGGKALVASYEYAAKGIDWRGSKLLEFAEFIRVTFRPNIGYLLIILTGLIYFTTNDPTIELKIVLSVLTLTGTVIGWFFGSRELNKKS